MADFGKYMFALGLASIFALATYADSSTQAKVQIACIEAGGKWAARKCKLED